jgi:predicted secreted Zn-dependent protease
MLLLPHPAGAEVAFRTITVPFSVKGATPAAVLKDLRHNGPLVEGRHAFARTRMSAELKARYRGPRGDCRVEKLRLRAKFEIRLPKAREYHRFSPVVKREWRQFVGILARHERAHVRIWQRCLSRAERRMRRLRAASCRHLKKRVHSAFREALRACDQMHERLDHRDVSRTSRIPFVRRALGLRRISSR